MPWKEIYVMDQKIQMISNWISGEYSISELSRIHGVSRKTVYKWIERYQNDREHGLRELSSRPVTFARATSGELVSEILQIKSRQSTWGARKILSWLKDHYPNTQWPVNSTVHEILNRHGLVKPRKKKRRTPPYTEPFLKVTQPNDVWCIDYKGQFRLGCGKYCYPLTLTDSYSRYLLDCQGLEQPSYEPTRYYIEKAFQRYGLPQVIRTDNGPPFASTGIRGLSRLSVWFIKLGIIAERIDKGHPEQNGRHERMHRTLKAEATKPPHYSIREQQQVFDQFIQYYNDERPHEGIGQKPPATVYRKSPRSYPDKLPSIDYPDHYQTRRIHTGGTIKWRNKEIYLSGVLAGEYVGLTEIDNGIWKIYFSFVPVALWDESTFTIQPLY